VMTGIAGKGSNDNATGCSEGTVCVRLELLPLRVCAALLYFRCLAQHITYQLIYINERVL